MGIKLLVLFPEVRTIEAIQRKEEEGELKRKRDGGKWFQLKLQTPTCKLAATERQTYHTALSASSRPGRCQSQVL